MGVLNDNPEYYDSIFSGLEVESLPVFDKKGSNCETSMVEHSIKTVSEAVDGFCKKAGIGQEVFFAGVFGIVAARYTNAQDAIFVLDGNDKTPIYCKFDNNTSISDYLTGLKGQIENSHKNPIDFSELADRYGISKELLLTVFGKGDDNQSNTVLHVYIDCKGDEYILKALYRCDIYLEDTIKTFLESYAVAIDSVMQCADMMHNHVCGVSILSKAQEDRLDSFNKTEMAYDTKKTVVDMFCRVAQQYSDNIAVVYQETKITYGELEILTRNLAGYIREQGLHKEDVVAILIPRCEYMAVTVLGVARSGCAYQPLDYTYPQDRLEFMTSDSGAKLLITTKEMRELIPEYKGDVLFIDDIPKLPTYDKTLEKPSPQDMFILLYTSGSTGVPKGCILEFGNITAFCHWYHGFYKLDSSCRTTAYASFGFDASMMDTFCSLTAGAQLHIIADDIRLDLLALNDYFEKNQITNGFMTTQVCRQFALGVENHSLNYMSTGGEKLVPMEPPKGYKFVNLYGPTECTVLATAFVLDKYYEDIPIGKAIDNIKLYVVDANGHRLPPGACGELLISGRQVSRGYLNRSEKTAEVFAVNPYTDEIGYERLYHTGDVVRYLGDGNISFVGRRDAQVKIRGFRIELTEVEEVIRRFTKIKDATVAAFEEEGGGKYIAAYVVSDEIINIEELNNFILETKPSYMVPAVTMQIDQIPLNQNQKVNKKALPKPKKKVEEKIAPQNEVQQKIFDCVADAVGHREFGITTDIYYAGLTSVSAIRLNVLLAKAFDVIIKTSDLKENPTVQKLEQFVSHADKIEKTKLQDVYPLTNTQYGVFIDSTANMGTTVYNIPYLFLLDSEVDLQKLKDAIEQTIDAHSYLKVQLFMNENGDICQRRNDSFHYEVEMVEGLDLENIVRPFNLFGELLFRFEIHTTYEGSYLFLDIHHIIIDGTSLAIVLNDINRAYDGELLTKEVYSSFDVALDQEKLINSQAYKAAQDFYRNMLEGCKGSTEFYPDMTGGEPKVGLLTKNSPVIEKAKVEAFCKQYGITENVFFVGAFGAMLARYNFEDEAVFTTIYHGRNDSRLTDTVGMLVKTMPVICNTKSDTRTYFTKLQNELMEMMDHDIYPFSEISRNYNIHPNAMVVYQGDNFNFDTLCGKKTQSMPLPINAAKAPVSIAISYDKGSYLYELEYRSDMFEKETADILLANMDFTVENLLSGARPSDIHLMFDEETQMVDNPDYMGKTFVDLFKDAAKTYSERKAVIDENGSITYGELDRISDYIADKLVKNGFGTEQIAGILCGRTREYVAAYVGIMKAGGAYMPLDPEYPQDRLAYMLSDSGAKNLLAIKEYVPLVGEYDHNIIYLDDVERESAEFIANQDFNGAKPENLAYVIYTSGSTGKPKGVMLEQRNLVNLIEQEAEFHNTVPEDVYGEYASFCFDASVHDLFVPLTKGAALYLFPESIRKDVIELCRAFVREGITVSSFPTQMGELVVETLKEDCALRILTLGGEKFKRYYDRKYMLVNGYGPTENTVSATEFVVDKEYKNIPIGKSQLNVRSYIVDENLKLVPVGAPGELCLAGRQIARGYRNLPEKTASVFIDNPFAICDDEKRMYRTGDMVRRKPDGNFEYIGRIDNQIKIRGYRVELGEIEGAVLRHEGVVETAVVAVAQGSNIYIAAYYTGKEYPEDEWMTFLKPILPEYMLPTYYIHMDAMPVTPGGKIDKKALPKPKGSAHRNNYVASQTPVQDKLCKMFEKALGMDQVGIDDDFFEIGGTSLSASKLAVLCLNEKLPLVYADIFKYHTVRQLSDVIFKDKQQKNNSELEFSDYSYYEIDKLLAYNDVRNLDKIKLQDLGNLLLTGATGFLGIHILKEYLTNYEGVAYCLVRKGHYQTPEKHLMNMLMYYFDSPYEELFGDRIICFDADITDSSIVENLKDIPFDTLINCAACVKHFASNSQLEQINVKGVENMIRLCQKTNKKLIQISTVSVGGEGIDNMPPIKKRIREKDLYFHQRITNEYIRTKFLAERAVLAEVVKGLNAKVIRVGNLMSRNSDGEFQINFITNGFLRTLRGYVALGKFPVENMNEGVEFSPIDCTATAVLKVAGTTKEFTLLHATNSHRIYMSDVIYAMWECGFNIEIVPGKDFEVAINEYAATHEGSDAMSGLIAYASREDSQIYTIDYENSFTTQMLYRLGYKWPITDDRYLVNAIKALEGLNFFDVK